MFRQIVQAEEWMSHSNVEQTIYKQVQRPLKDILLSLFWCFKVFFQGREDFICILVVCQKNIAALHLRGLRLHLLPPN